MIYRTIYEIEEYIGFTLFFTLDVFMEQASKVLWAIKAHASGG